MYAVIRTGGKQYRVQPGDILVVERLAGEPGAAIAFDDVLMIGAGEDVSLGSPMIAGAKVEATLIETRKGEKTKIFKKTRRQGYRRTRGHRQIESVLRVTGIAAGEASERWDGSVDLTPRSVLNARARNLARGMEAAEAATLARTSSMAVTAEPAGEGAPESGDSSPARTSSRKSAAKGASPAKAKAAPAKKPAHDVAAKAAAETKTEGKAPRKKTAASGEEAPKAAPARRRKPAASEEA